MKKLITAIELFYIILIIIGYLIMFSMSILTISQVIGKV